jgi:hypothetical protein
VPDPAQNRKELGFFVGRNRVFYTAYLLYVMVLLPRDLPVYRRALSHRQTRTHLYYYNPGVNCCVSPHCLPPIADGASLEMGQVYSEF